MSALQLGALVKPRRRFAARPPDHLAEYPSSTPATCLTSLSRFVPVGVIGRIDSLLANDE